MFKSPREHAKYIFESILKAGIKKYLVGQREHKGMLWKVPVPQLISFAQEEVIDQGSYLWTLESQILVLRKNLGELFEMLSEAEEPPTPEQKKIIKEVSLLLSL